MKTELLELVFDKSAVAEAENLVLDLVCSSESSCFLVWRTSSCRVEILGQELLCTLYSTVRTATQ
jgi:hypothetical protein